MIEMQSNASFVVPAVRLTVQPLLGVFQTPEIADLDVHLGGVAVDVIHSIALLEIVTFAWRINQRCVPLAKPVGIWMVDNALSVVTIVQVPINATKCLVLVTMDVKRVGMVLNA